MPIINIRNVTINKEEKTNEIEKFDNPFIPKP
jgi:hypothetical protein